VLVDAKYKRWRSHRIPAAADAYQVIAGGRAASAEDVVLVYPRMQGIPTAPVRWKLAGAGTTVRLSCLSIDLTLMAEDDGDDRLAEALRRDLGSVLS
jgi:5-methylcytosine-specific restriction endonuclease McrBC regulatory subunit McrC